MKKMMFLSLLVVATLTLSACGITKEEAKESVEKVGESTKISASKLFEMGGKQKCTWSDEKNNVAGTTYMDGERMRMETKNAISGANGKTGDSFMINDGEYTYSWETMTKKGMKIKNEAEEEMMETEISEGDASEYESKMGMGEGMEEMEEMEYEYNCEKWKVDESKFVPPTDVEFQDMNQMINDMENRMKDLEGMGGASGATVEGLDIMSEMQTTVPGM
ncbi:MAG: hypothetical protein ABFQ53_00205 [Patescibacteria group bacterium]